jgi:hypothetical protein
MLIFFKTKNGLIVGDKILTYHMNDPLQSYLVITILIMVYAWADISARGTFHPRSKSRYIGSWH